MAEEITQQVKVSQRTDIVTPNQLLALAIETKADPDRLDKLMDLQIKWEANQAKKAYVAAMSNFRSKCPMIEKTRKVDFPGKSGGQVQFKYAGLSEIIEKIKSLMSECGLSHSWRTEQANGSILIRCIVTHIGGHSEETSLSAPPDNTGSKNSIQAIASTVSYLERYTLFALLGLASQDMDNDGNGNGKEKPKPEDDVTKLIEQAFFNFSTEHTDEVADGFACDGTKFKEALRKEFSGLSAAKKKGFKWTTESIADLQAKIKTSDVLVEVK
jgi:hypothetical protein